MRLTKTPTCVFFSARSLVPRQTEVFVQGGIVFTYTQAKKAFTYFYGKRKVLEDGVTTTFLDTYKGL